MKTLFLDAPYAGKAQLLSKTLLYLQEKKYHVIALYASVQFVKHLDLVKQQLIEAGVTVVTSKADRTHVVGQLLGCDSYMSSLHLKQDIDCYLYLGDGRFHPLALVYAQKDSPEMKEVVCDDPIAGTMTILSVGQIKRILQRYRASLMTFLRSDRIGVLITVKPGQQQYKPGLALETKFPEKKFYYFVDNTISFDQLENFPFIQTWVNTACPRIGFDDSEKFEKGVLNLNDALLVKEILAKKSALTTVLFFRRIPDEKRETFKYLLGFF